jgi:hypothetical protein
VIGDTLEGGAEDTVEISAEMGLFRSKLSEVYLILMCYLIAILLYKYAHACQTVHLQLILPPQAR